MASPVEAELARRDKGAAYPQSSGRASYMRPEDRLRAEALDYRKEHDADLMAAREAMLAQKEAESIRRMEGADFREKITTAKMGLAEKEFAIQEKIRLLDEKGKQLALDQKLEQLNRTEKRMAEADIYFKEAGALDPFSKDFDAKFADLTRRTLSAGDHPDVAMNRKYLLGEREKGRAYDMSFAPKPAEAPKPRDFGTVTTKVDEATTTNTPLPAPGTPEDQRELLAQHAKLEAKLVEGRTSVTGGYKAADIGALNAVKVKLGFDLLDPATGKVIPKAIPAAAATPPAAVAEPSKTIVVPAGQTTVLPTAATPVATAAKVAPTAASAATTAKTVWKVDANGVKWEFDPTTKKPTGKYVKSS